MNNTLGWLMIAGMAAMLGGCAGGRTSLMPNPDPLLRAPSVKFAAAAAKRTYPTTMPRGGEAPVRAMVSYGIGWLDMENLSTTQLDNVLVWVNGKYSVLLPRMEPKILKRISFAMLYDDAGHPYSTEDGKNFINKVEIVLDGKLYDVKTQLSD